MREIILNFGTFKDSKDQFPYYIAFQKDPSVMDNAQRTESVKTLIENVDKGYIKLPEFQRDFVWDIGKTYDLFDSLARDVFIGTIIYGIPSFDVTVRELDNRRRKEKGKRRRALKKETFTMKRVNAMVKSEEFRLILDGQQRVTSLFRALNGIDEIWFIAKNEDELLPQVLKKSPDDRFIEESLFEFTGREDPNRVSIKISDVWRKIQGDFKRESQTKQLFRESLFIKNRLPKITDEEFETLVSG